LCHGISFCIDLNFEIFYSILIQFFPLIFFTKTLYIHMVNIQRWPHESFHQDLNLELQSNNPLLLPSNHLIWFETNHSIILFNTLFISNVLQKANFSYYYPFHTMSKWKKLNFIIYIPRFSHIKIYEENQNQLIDYNAFNFLI